MSKEYTFTGYLGPEFQLKLMWQILTESEFGEKILSRLEITYFDDPNLKRLFIVINEYFNEYGKIPNLQNQSIFTAIKKYKIEGDATDELILEGVVEKIKNWNDRILNKNLEYDGDIIQKECYFFIKQQEYRRLADYIHTKIKTGDIKSTIIVNNIEEKIKEINNIGDTEDYGIEVFENIERALRKEFREPIPTGIDAIDTLMGGGLGRGEIGIVLAPSGFGKTTILTKFANEALEHGKNVLQIIFEDTEDQVRRKHFTIWSKIEQNKIDENREFVYERIREHSKTLSGKLIIKKFSQEDTTISGIRYWIERFQKKFGITFNIIILDYLDCVEPHKKSVDLTHGEINVVKAFEAMASDYNIPCWTALQTNREGFGSEFVYTQQMGGSIKRAQKTHFLMSIARTQDQKEANLANIQILKARFAQDGQQFKDCIFNNGTMEIRVDSNKIRKFELDQYNKEELDVEKLNTKIHDIEEKISHKQENSNIKLDMNTTSAVKNLLNIKKDEEKSADDYDEFLNNCAKNQKVISDE